MIHDKKKVTVLQCNIKEHGVNGLERILLNKEADILCLQELVTGQAKLFTQARFMHEWAFVANSVHASRKTRLGAEIQGAAYIAYRKSFEVIETFKTTQTAGVHIKGVGIFLSFYMPTERSVKKRKEAAKSKQDMPNELNDIGDAIIRAKNKIQKQEVVAVFGDTNATHPTWSSRVRDDNREEVGDYLVEIFQEEEMSIITPKDTITFVWPTHIKGEEGGHTIDIAAVTEPIEADMEIRLDIINSQKKKMNGCRHNPLLYKLKMDQHEAEEVAERKNRFLHHSKYNAEILQKELNTALSSFDGTETDIDSFWAFIQEALVTATGKAKPISKHSPRYNMPGWNSVCDEAKEVSKQVRKASQLKHFEMARQTHGHTLSKAQMKRIAYQKSNEDEEVRQALKRFRTARRQALAIHDRNTVQEICQGPLNDIWPALNRKLGKVKPKKQIRELKKSEETAIAKDPDGIAKVLFNTHFAQFQRVKPNSVIKDHQKAFDENQQITKGEIWLSLSADPNGAPGEDSITAGLIKLCWETSHQFEKALTHLYQLCFSQATVPTSWRKAVISPLYKEKGQALNLASSWRPIALQNCASKVYERIVANRLQYAVRNGALDSDHFGALLGRSAEDALLVLGQYMFQAYQASRTLHQNAPTTIISGIDVKGAFNVAQHSYLIESLRNRLKKVRHACGDQTHLIAIIGNWLQKREICLATSGTLGQSWHLSDEGVGIPQGSPLSPILWLFYVEPLFKAINTRWKAENVRMLAFVDDITFITQNQTFPETQKLTNEVHEVVQEWSNRAKVHLDKGFLLHITSKDAKENRISGIRLAGDPPTKIRYFDRFAKILGNEIAEWNWALSAVQQRASAASSALFELRPANSAPACVKWALAQSILWPKLEYGLAAYLPFNLNARKVIEATDFRILCWILGIRKASWAIGKYSYLTLCSMLGIRPIGVRLWYKLRMMGVKRYGHVLTEPTKGKIFFHSGHVMNQRQGPMELMCEGVDKVRLPSMIEPKRQVSPFHKVHIAPSKEEAKEQYKQVVRNFSGIRIYTDGSVLEEREKSGYGFVIYKDGEICFEQMVANYEGELVGSHWMEVSAIEHVLRMLPSMEEMEQFRDEQGLLPSIKIFTDSQSAAWSLKQPKKWSSDCIVDKARKAAESLIQYDLAKEATLEIHWIPGHCKIEGNERADQLAGWGALMTSEPVEGQTVRREAKERSWEMAVAEYKEPQTCIHLGLQYAEFRGEAFKSFALRLTRAQCFRRLNWLSGHIFLRGIELDCHLCEETLPRSSNRLESHLILYCPATAKFRVKYNVTVNKEKKWKELLLEPTFDEYLKELDKLHLRFPANMRYDQRDWPEVPEDESPFEQRTPTPEQLAEREAFDEELEDRIDDEIEAIEQMNMDLI